MDPFLGPWIIDSWQKDSDVPEGIPGHGFKVGGPLNITQPDANVNSVHLQWKNDNDRDCSVSGLQYDETLNQLEGQNLTTIFPDKSVPCNFQVKLADTSGRKITLSIVFVMESSASGGVVVADPEVGGGVVTATAHP